MVEYGFQPETNSASFDIYERAGSSIYYHLHDVLKYKKVGYRKISDHVTREIRHGRLQLKQGKSLITHYTNSKVNVKPFFDWLGVTRSGYEWFKMHKLGENLDLISESDVFDKTPKFPDLLKINIGESKNANEKHLIYGKGV